MPIYEYRCQACGHQEEFLQKVSEPPLAECPACHKPALQKLLSAAGFQLKGSGWYATDFKNKAPAKAGTKTQAKAEATTETKAEAKTEAKADTKTDTKPESKAANTATTD